MIHLWQLAVALLAAFLLGFASYLPAHFWLYRLGERRGLTHLFVKHLIEPMLRCVRHESVFVLAFDDEHPKPGASLELSFHIGRPSESKCGDPLAILDALRVSMPRGDVAEDGSLTLAGIVADISNLKCGVEDLPSGAKIVFFAPKDPLAVDAAAISECFADMAASTSIGKSQTVNLLGQGKMRVTFPSGVPLPEVQHGLISLAVVYGANLGTADGRRGWFENDGRTWLVPCSKSLIDGGMCCACGHPKEAHHVDVPVAIPMTVSSEVLVHTFNVAAEELWQRADAGDEVAKTWLYSSDA